MGRNYIASVLLGTSVALVLLAGGPTAHAQAPATNAFTYQGAGQSII